MMNLIGRRRAAAWLAGALVILAAAALVVAARPGASPAGSALSLEGTAAFAPGELRWGTFQDYSTVDIPGFVSQGEAGCPELPERSYYYLVPHGYHVAELRVGRVDRRDVIGSRRLLPARVAGWEENGIAESPAVYGRAEEFPGRPVELAGVGYWRGERIAQVRYRPVGYRPADGRISLYPRVEYTLVLEPGETGEAPVRALRGEARAAGEWRKRLASFVENPPPEEETAPLSEGVALGVPFRPTDYPSLDGSLVEYVIVTTDDYAAQFQTLADWKTQKGVPAVVRTTSWINTHYPQGLDLAERIRLFIRDAYEKWGTEYVLLGGDTDRIPTRYAFTNYYFPEGENIPADIYYAALDGDWDNDRDGIFGEGYTLSTHDPGDSVDVYPEVSVGRAPANTLLEVQTFVTKTKNYRLSPVAQYQNTACFIGEVLFPYGWDPPAPPDPWLNGCDIADDAIQWITPSWDTVKICEWPNWNMNYNNVKAALNTGYGLVSIITHGDAFKISTSEGNYIRIDDMQGLVNTNKYSIYYYSNCNSSQFDAECLNEYALFNGSGGCAACIGPSRLEFPHQSRNYLEEFYRLLFRSNLDALGELDDAHRVKFAGQTGANGAQRWIYLAQVLLGDPELRVWKSLPDSMTLTHAGSMALSDTTYTVTITHLGAPVQGALATLWNSATGNYARGFTNGAGQIVFHYCPVAPGTLTLSATHPLYKTRNTSVTVNAGAARIQLAGVVIDDDASGLSAGNGDGVADAGERIELGVKLKNTGGVSVTGVQAGLALAAGSRLTLHAVENGWTRTDRVFVGADGLHPGALPVAIQLSGDTLNPWAQPLYTAYAAADTGAYFWQDLAGWHLRLVGGQTAQTFTGYVRTDGQVRAAAPHRLETGDVYAVSADSVGFSVALDSSDVEDGLDLVLADSSGVSVFLDTASYGTMAPGDTATQFFLVENAVGTGDQHQARFDVTVTGNAPGPVSWREGLRMEVGSAVLAEEYHAVDDSTDGGNRDGRIQIGETVRLLSSVRNSGHGAAIGVQGTLRAITGVTVLDSTETYGDIAAGALVAGNGNGFRLSSSSLTMRVSLELRDAYGRSWTEEMELGVPAAPTAVVERPQIPLVQTAVDLSWTPPMASDIRGYNVYRSPTGGSGYAKINGGLVEVSAFYQDLAVQNGTPYYYRVAAVDSSGNESPRSAEAAITVRPGWQGVFPRSTEGTVWSSPVVADLGEDASGDREIIVGSEDGYLYCFNPDGTSRAGWPKYLGEEIWSSPAVGNLDSDPQLEIVVGCNSGKVYAFNYNGTGLINTDGLFATLGGEVRAAPVLVDLDRDGSLEVVVGAFNQKLYAFRKDGTPYGSTSVFATVSGAIAAAATACDLDGNGDVELLVPTLGGKVYAWNHDKTGFKDSTGVLATVPTSIWANVAVGDVDANGFMDVIAATWGGKIYRWNRLGTLQPGWPYSTGDQIWGSPALGDLDGDGKIDILVGSYDNKMYALKYDATALAGWPVTLPDSIWGSAAMADLSGDGIPEVIVGCIDKKVYALKRNGTNLPGWPILLPERLYGSCPAVTDLDRDGDVEVVVGAYDGRVWCWDVHQPWNSSPSASPWPMYGHDAYRTSFYNSGTTDVAEGGGAGPPPAIYDLAQNTPNPFNPRTTVRYQMAADGPATLAIYDVSGRRVRTLVSGTTPAGRHEVVWDGRDEEGREAASGVYFTRFEAGGKTFSRKMILAR